MVTSTSGGWTGRVTRKVRVCCALMKAPLHIVNGDTVAQSLADTDIAGEILVWADALDLGPLHPNYSESIPDRSAFWRALEVGATRDLNAQEQSLHTAVANASEVTLWYEHDLFDQVALVRLISHLTSGAGHPQISMVSIDNHPEVPNFVGLGQLAPHQLAALWPARIPVGKDMIEEAAAAWLAIAGPDPRAITFVARRVRALPFLAQALERYVEEMPDTANGLGRMERQVLGAVARGCGNADEVVRDVAPSDPRYQVTDVVTQYVGKVLRAAGMLSDWAITAAGREVLAGHADRVRTQGISLWRGGVRYEGKGACWRWDARARRPVWSD